MHCRLPVALIVMAAIAGCGGDDGDGDETTAAATSTEQAAEAGVDAATAQRVRELIPLARQPQQGKSRKESLRIADAQAELLTIASKDPEAIAPLLAALEKPDYGLIIDMHQFFIQLGKPGSEKVIGEALQRLEPSPQNNTVVFAYLGSGNGKLVRAAEEWAADNGYTISGEPTPQAGGWGSAGVYGPALPPGVQAVPGP
jgi:hypothetical protein